MSPVKSLSAVTMRPFLMSRGIGLSFSSKRQKSSTAKSSALQIGGAPRIPLAIGNAVCHNLRRMHPIQISALVSTVALPLALLAASRGLRSPGFDLFARRALAVVLLVLEVRQYRREAQR